ncbi:unnamed protein product [Rhodiola kirilowii]
MKDAKTLEQEAIEAGEESLMNLTVEENIKASEEIKSMKAAGFMVKTAEKKSSATVEKEKKSATVEKEKKSATVEKTEDSKQFEALVKQAQSPSASPGLKQWLSDISSIAKLYGPDDDDVAQDNCFWNSKDPVLLFCVPAKELHISVSSLVASAVVWTSKLPEKLNPVILPLMASIKREQLVRSITPVLDDRLRAELLSLLPCIFKCVSHLHVAVRLAASKCITSMTISMTKSVMGAVLETITPMLGDSTSAFSRQGAGMLVGLLVQELGVKLVPHAPYLVVPLLKCMGDCDHSVRQTVTRSFAALVPLLPLARGLPPPDVTTLQYAGSAEERASFRGQLDKYKVIITSYDVVRKDIEYLGKLSWNYCILDEGHIIKNSKSIITSAVKQLKAQHRLVLSGTPIQPLVAARDSKCSAKDAEAGALAMEALHKQVMPFLLRRTKDEVLSDLPEKIIQDRYCDLSPVQLKLYDQFSGSHVRHEISSMVKKNESIDKEPSSAPKASSHVFQGACLELNAGKWSECMLEICAFHQLPAPLDDDRLPVGSGSNPVYSSLQQNCKDGPKQYTDNGFPFGLWSKKLFEYRIAGMSIQIHESSSILGSAGVWPYIITKRCEGKTNAQLRDTLPGEDVLELASFLGEQLRFSLIMIWECGMPDINIFSKLKELELSHKQKSYAGLDASGRPDESLSLEILEPLEHLMLKKVCKVGNCSLFHFRKGQLRANACYRPLHLEVRHLPLDELELASLRGTIILLAYRFIV